MEYVERLVLLDTVERLEDRLEDLLAEKQISAASYHRKKAFKVLLRAVNGADRHIAALRKRSKTAALFVPAGLHTLPLPFHDVYAAEPVESVLESTLASVHPSGIEAFLYNEPWNEIVGINSSITVYGSVMLGEAPMSQVLRTAFRPASQADFIGGKLPENCFWYDVTNRILHLGKALDKDSFLVFEATTLPGSIDVRKYDVGNRDDAEATDLSEHTLDTPLIFEDTLMSVALAKLLPGLIPMPSPAEVDFAMSGLEAGNGAVLYNMLDE